MAVGDNAPVIIKRKKVIAGGGHHGGAWKVAYADFVTAMMAFFMLMWLLNATTEQQRKGIADYFSPTVPIVRVSGGGSGAFGGMSMYSEDVQAQNGTGATQALPSIEMQAMGMDDGENGLSLPSEEAQALKEAEEILLASGGESLALRNALRHVVTRLTDEGLIIEIFDLEGSPLFAPDTSEPSAVIETLAGLLAQTFAIVENGVAVEGHTAAYPTVLADNPSWDLSAARADVFRELLEGAGLASERVARMAGHADRKPAARNPMAVRNNRLEVILLRSDR